MSNEFDKLREIFLEAVEQHAPEAWPAFLDRACGGDPALRVEVELLLDAHVAEGRSGVTPSRDDRFPSAGLAPGDWIGKKVGPYKLVELIGDGGMGSVFMAEQVEPIQRRVALKLVKPGMDSKQVLARFEAERQALALMDHPNIAKVLDAGSTEWGQPYFVMELIRGVPITQFCDDRRLAPEERLRLCIPVCNAIQHAHQKGVIHRDVKPSNVLVALYDGVPVPKVIDFGIAKAVRQPLTEKTLVTGFGAIVGTLEYMSPEQAELNQLDVDTRSDVYGLGVLLYELLTGTTPILPERLKRSANLEILRLIREEEPPAPSTRLETTEEIRAISANRGTEPKRLSGLVRGELDWIVMRCLEKDRNRRYETADGLARDLERYLSGEPVDASSPSRYYRFRKLALKYRRGVATAAAFVAVLLVAAVVSTWLAIRATGAEAAAKEQAEVAQAINNFLQNDLLASANTGSGGDRDLKLRTVLDRAGRRVDAALADRPLVRAGVHNTIGAAYTSLSDYSAAETHLRKSVEIYESVRGATYRDTLAARGNLAVLIFREGHLAEAARMQQEVLAGLRATVGPSSPDAIRAMNNLTNVLLAMGRTEDGRKLVEETVPLAERALGADADSTLIAKGNLARIYSAQRRYENARKLDEELLATCRKKFGDTHVRTLVAMGNLAVVFRLQHRLDEARRLYVEELEAKKKTLGPEHAATLVTMYNLAELDAAAGRNEEARVGYERVLEVQRRVLGTAHTDTIRSMMGLGIVLHRLGRNGPSRALFEEALASQRKALGKDHPDTFRIMAALADLDVDDGRAKEAKALYEGALDGYRRALGPSHPATLEFANNVAWILATSPTLEVRDPARALDIARAVVARTPDNGNAWNTIGVAEYRLGKWPDAIRSLRKSMELRRGGDANDFLFLAMAHWRSGDRDEARSWYKKAADAMAAGPAPGPELERFRAEADALMRNGGR